MFFTSSYPKPGFGRKMLGMTYNMHIKLQLTMTSYATVMLQVCLAALVEGALAMLDSMSLSLSPVR